MKLVYAVVHSDDGRRVMDELNRNGFSVTKLCSTGGFLKSGNTTLITVVEEDKVNDVIGIIKKKSKSRKEIVNPSMPNNGVGGIMLSYPLEVTVGGATVFVVNVERFEKV